MSAPAVAPAAKRRRLPAAWCLAVGLVAGPACAATPLAAAAPPHPERVMEVTSYGERPRDLVALLVPFLGRLQFSPSRPVGSLVGRDGAVAFSHPHGDFIAAAGRFNCVVLVYYASPVGTSAGGRPGDRAAAFAAALVDFLDGLPTPRPQPREVEWGSAYCGAAN